MLASDSGAAAPAAGGARLAFARVGERTVVQAARSAGPLRLLTPNNHGAAAWVYTTTLGGGLVDGDALELGVHVAQGATALVSSMGALRVYRSRRGSSSTLRAQVDEGGLLALLPDPVSCFAGARCEQRTRVELGPGASLIVAEALTAGRTAHGERWAFARWSNELEVRCEQRTAVRDALLLDAAHGALPQRLGRMNALATLLLLGPQLAQHAAALRAQLDAAPLPPRSALLQAASPVRDGVLLRMAGESPEALVQTVRAHLSFLPALLGDDPFARRA